MIKSTDNWVYLYMFIFLLFFIVEIFATIFGVYLYKKMSKVYNIFKEEQEWIEKETKALEI